MDQITQCLGPPATDTDELRPQLRKFLARFQEIQSRIDDIQSAVSEVQSNNQNLLVDIQQFLSHDNPKSDDTIPTSKTCVPRAKERLSFRNAELPSKNAVFLAECPHPDCANKIKTQFSRRKNLKRHYMSHLTINEPCLFCKHEITDVLFYVTHFNTCSTRKKQEKDGVLHTGLGIEANLKREKFLKMADNQLDRHLFESGMVAFRASARTKRRRNANGVTEESRKERVIAQPETDVPVEQINAYLPSNEQGIICTQTAIEEGHEARPGSPGVQQLSPTTERSELHPLSELTAISQTTWNDTSGLNCNDYNGALPLRAPFGASYTMDDPYGDISFPLRAPFGASYTMDDPYHEETTTSAQPQTTSKPFHDALALDAFVGPYQTNKATFPVQTPCSDSYGMNEPLDQFRLARALYADSSTAV